jgi:4-azaleucine resistance transporter AzlC
LFAAGTTLLEAVLVQLVVNARHIAYGLSMMNRLRDFGPIKYYIIFGMTDETFALLSSIPENNEENSSEQAKFMFLVTLLNHSYWVFGGIIGVIAGSLLPFSTEGIAFALTALFIVLMIEQINRVRRPGIFAVSAIMAVLCVFILHFRISLLAAMALALAVCSFLPKANMSKENGSKK